MSGRSSPSRRTALFLALALAGGAGLLPALSWLAKVRSRHDALSAILQAPARQVQPLLAAGVAFRGGQRRAEIALTSTVRDLASRERALIEQIEPRPAPAPGLVARHAVLSGDARAMLRLIEAIESREPALRMPTYRLATNASGRSLRLEADIVMAFAS